MNQSIKPGSIIVVRGPILVSLLLTFIIGCLFACNVYASSRADSLSVGLLERTYMQPGVSESFRTDAQWWPFPDYSDRDQWEKIIPQEQRKSLILSAENKLNYRWQHIPASTFIALNTTGDKQEMRRIERANRQAIIDLMVGEIAEGKGRFLPQIADGLWFYATAHNWSHSNQTEGVLPRYQNERIALGNIRHAATLPIVYHIFKDEIDKIEPMIGETFRQTVRRIILDPFLDDSQDGQNWWLGFKDGVLINNWNPWCNHGVMLAFLLMETDQERLDRAIAKSVKSVDKYLAAYSSDGGCEEGATYWEQSVSRFCEYLQLMRDASGGRFEVLPDKFIRRMGEFKSRVTISRDMQSGKTLSVNYGDGSMIGESNVWMLWNVGQMLDIEELRDLALYGCCDFEKKVFAVPSLSSDEGYRVMQNIRSCVDLAGAAAILNNKLDTGGSLSNLLDELRADVPSVTWYEDLQQAFVRTEEGLFVSAKAGHNGEPHGHNDVGNFIICLDGVPFIVDPGVGTYVKNTFGANRYTIWTMQSPWHNCPMPSGTVQMNGKDYSEGRKYAASDVAFSNKSGKAILKQQMRGAYPEDSGCTSWVRTLSVKNNSVSVVDEYELAHRSGADVETFITPGTISLEKNAALITSHGKVMKVEWSQNLTGSVEEKIMDDDKLSKVWGEKLYRLILKSAENASLKGKYTITFKTY